MVVAVGIIARFGPQGVGPTAADQNAHAGVPHIAGQGRGGALGKGQHFLLGQCGLDVVIQVDALAVVRVVQSVGIRLLQCVRPIPGGQRHQRGTGYALTKQKLPHAASSRQGAAIGKVQIIGPGNVHIDNVLGHVAYLRLGPHIIKYAGGNPAQQVQRVEHRQRGVAVILCTLAATAVLAVVLQKAVNTVGSLLYVNGQCLRRGALGGGQQHVLGTPGGPVAHWLLTVAHPPEMRGAVGGQHPAIHFAFQTDGKSGSVTIQCSA